ncbi:MAG TPA: glycosyltransferase family 9 protein [Candidatus Saccharimonadales bacterium]|nr:glycosyltransferase family 9 protein [Candidatus Saccharimonadales bacterium]
MSGSSFFELTRGARKIIVVDFGFLGDSVHLVPALWEIKRHYPGAEIHTLSATLGAELLKLAPCVDRPWAIPLTVKSPPFWKHWDILRALRRQRFDAAFNFTGTDRSLFAMAFIGAPRSLVCAGGRKHFWNRWVATNWVPRQTQELPVFEQRRQVLAASGFSLQPPRFDLRVPEEATRWAAGAIIPGSIHLSINASASTKEWPIENWIEFAQILLSKNAALTLVATASAKPREQERLKTLAGAVNQARLRTFTGLQIGQLAGLLQRCRLQIGADSGVLHLAMALGIPTVTVFREYPGWKEWIPTGAGDRYFLADCRCSKENRSDCVAADRAACLASIPAEKVASLVLEGS